MRQAPDEGGLPDAAGSGKDGEPCGPLPGRLRQLDELGQLGVTADEDPGWRGQLARRNGLVHVKAPQGTPERQVRHAPFRGATENLAPQDATKLAPVVW
ncbi:hypothetical protein Acsp02_22190 [Actinoplanes sp. NBRC 103695]|nr:hypothetical protein Acsp02_22190 [Actinoplanes sp. NBRC 103695]